MINQKDTIPEQEGSGCSTAVEEHKHQEKKITRSWVRFSLGAFFLFFPFPLRNEPKSPAGKRELEVILTSGNEEANSAAQIGDLSSAPSRTVADELVA